MYLKLGNLIIGFGIVVLISCSSNRNERSLSSDTFESDSLMIDNKSIASQSDSLITVYLDILEGLKCEYVLYAKQPYHSYDKLDTVKFNSDSIKYFDSYERFFNQDYEFLGWLLEFKGDTARSGLWQKYHNPISSYLGECHLPMTNERAAINLIENFLNGDELVCHECKHNDIDCNDRKYEQIENFLSKNRDKRIEELREEWIKNAH